VIAAKEMKVLTDTTFVPALDVRTKSVQSARTGRKGDSLDDGSWYLPRLYHY